ncbi:hypothetical protein LOK49_LG13G00527 [Camellia lanceoleosa]|uniref:Uncharacterized protein n=1 Tax=Camellia lanceoleosa TaxID=1840588 RepID=A0ACC0FJY1_9ERIC|nr:hypothetical protein LOK49_LG13G00527 [Camellia lanceoleosa]
MGRFPHFFSLLPIFSLTVIFLSTTIALPQPAAALPLSTDSRWIVDETGRRVKLSCVNWASHLDAVVAEGLSKQPIDSISKKIVSMGFNCVRLTWPLFLATNDSLANTTVRQSFRNLGLIESIAGFQVNNPSIIDHSLISAFQAVVSSLGDNNVMVILDNHISKPGWCCSKFDGSGFFGDQYFNPDLWIKGLTMMASLFKGTPNVVGMSLRNELHAPKKMSMIGTGPAQQGAKQHKVIFHPLTGQCIHRKSLLEPLKLGPCTDSEAWSYNTQQKTLTIKGTYFCLQAAGLNKPAKLGVICSDSTSKWELISDSKMHLSSKLTTDGAAVCLDVDPSSNIIITNNCKCLNRDNMCDPGSQWFKIVNSTRSSSVTTLFFGFNSVFDFLRNNMLGSLVDSA